jgi:tRNA pseudouridine38-40 synthase
LISSQDLGGELQEFRTELNTNLPQDIQILDMEVAREDLNIIGDISLKEYGYFFTLGKEHHPFSAPFSTHFTGDLDLPLMREVAPVFEGEHYFHNFTARLQPGKKIFRQIRHCRIEENKELKASFLPEGSFMLSVKGEGFMRYQIRMMMGALVLLGQGQITAAHLKKSLLPGENYTFPYIAPASGLVLLNMHFR